MICAVGSLEGAISSRINCGSSDEASSCDDWFFELILVDGRCVGEYFFLAIFFFFFLLFAGIRLAVIWDDVAGKRVSGVRPWIPVGPVYVP